MQEKVGAMISGRGASFTDQQNEIEFVPKIMIGSENIDAEESVAESVDPEDDQTIDITPSAQADPAPGAGDPPTTAPTEPELSPEGKKIMGNLKVAYEEFPVEFKKACMALKLGFGEGVEYTVDQAKTILKKVSELVDQFG